MSWLFLRSSFVFVCWFSFVFFVSGVSLSDYDKQRRFHWYFYDGVLLSVIRNNCVLQFKRHVLLFSYPPTPISKTLYFFLFFFVFLFCYPFLNSIVASLSFINPFWNIILVLFCGFYTCCPFPFLIVASFLQANFLTYPLKSTLLSLLAVWFLCFPYLKYYLLIFCVSFFCVFHLFIFDVSFFCSFFCWFSVGVCCICSSGFRSCHKNNTCFPCGSGVVWGGGRFWKTSQQAFASAASTDPSS